MEKFNFNPPNIFIDESSYPDPINTDESREQLSRPHLQMREFINELVDEVNREKSSDEISYKHDNLSAVTNVKQGLDEHYRLIKETQNHLNDSDENFNTHKNNNEIHVTSSEKSRWNNTYTKDETDAAISRKVVQIGAGDMAQHIYDKDGDGTVDNAEHAILADRAKIASYAETTNVVRTSSGEFITVETEKKSAAALVIHGKTYQKTYTGKNLYDVSQITKPSGLTVDNDGWVTLTRDNTSGTSTIYIEPNVPVSNLLKPDTNYTIVCEIATSTNVLNFEIVSKHNNLSQFNALYTSTKVGTHIIPSVTLSEYSSCQSMLRTVVSIGAGLSASLKFRYSVIEGTNVTAENFVYEPFCGGIPSPNPDFPQDVHGISTNKIPAGENLLEINGASKTENGITFTVNSDKSITINGTATASTSFKINNKVVFPDANSQYFLSSDDVYVIATDWSGLAYKGLLTPSEYTKDMMAVITINSGQTVSNKKVYPRLQVAEDTVVVKRTGKNLLKNNLMAGTTKNGITITLNDDGTVTANGTATDNAVFYYAYGLSALKNLTLGNEYILTGAPNGSSLSSYYLSTWQIDSSLTTKNEVGNGLKFLCTDKSNANVSIMVIVSKGVTVNNVLFKPMIRLASVEDSTFEPYSESTLTYNTTELFEGDSISSVGKLTRRFKKIVLDGVTSGLKATHVWNTNKGYQFGIPVKDAVENELNPVFSSHFISVNTGSGHLWNKEIDGINITSAEPELRIKMAISHPEITTVEQFNAWLKAQYDAGTPVTVVYELAVPTEEEAARNGDMILDKGINHVFSAEEFSPEFDLEYSPDGYPLFDWLYLNPEDIGAAPAVHNHDDRYFTENELNARLGTQCTFVLEGTTLTITTK